MSTPKWQVIQPQEAAEFGVRYRTSLVFHEMAFPIFGANVFRAMPRNGALLAGGRVKVHAVEDFIPGFVPKGMLAGQKPRSWGVRITWEKVAEGTPALVLAAAIIAVMVTATFMWIIAAKTTEKEMHQVAEDFGANVDKLKQLAQDTVFNPGLIIAAMVVAVLALKRR